MENKIYKKLKEPEFEIIGSILLISEGWIVGGSIQNIINDTAINDFDIIVPDRELFGKVIKLLSSIHQGYGINSYGGMKFQVKELRIDIWCEELGDFIMCANEFNYAYNYQRNILIKNA